MFCIDDAPLLTFAGTFKICPSSNTVVSNRLISWIMLGVERWEEREEWREEKIIENVYHQTKKMSEEGRLDEENMVRHIYKPFTPEDLCAKIAELITPKDVKIPVELIFQTIEDLHDCCPTNTGDWYFTGNYPTPVRVS